jgi:hypothetical protein
VEVDTSFTSTTKILVSVFAFLNQLGSYASENLFDWLGGTAIGTSTADHKTVSPGNPIVYSSS